jgi:CDP-diacylglycerol--glycerol-3-phosphate 3-phosphatidyltransferase
MTSADKITSIRLVLAPVFFIVYLLPLFNLPFGLHDAWFAAGKGAWTVPVLWLLFIVSEITDLLDGKVARKRNETSDFGKLFDPFADVLVRITYFLCFVIDGILPVILLLVVLYREFSILFVRILMMKKGIAMGARWGGKIKAVAYMIAGAVALLASSAERLGLDSRFYTWFRLGSIILFFISVVLALTSFADYITVYRKTGKES